MIGTTTFDKDAIMENVKPQNCGQYPDYAKDMIIQFTSYQDRIACGTLHSAYYERIFPFCGMDHLLLMMDDIMDSVNCPQAGFGHRSLKMDGSHGVEFQDLSSEQKITDFTAECSQVARFAKSCIAIRVLYRQQASMQGELRVNMQKFYFRSGLELMRLLHQFLKYEQEQKMLKDKPRKNTLVKSKVL